MRNVNHFILDEECQSLFRRDLMRGQQGMVPMNAVSTHRSTKSFPMQIIHIKLRQFSPICSSRMESQIHTTMPNVYCSPSANAFRNRLFLMMLLSGNTRISDPKIHMQYCIVMTLLKLTNAQVNRNCKQKGEMCFEYRKDRLRKAYRNGSNRISGLAADADSQCRYISQNSGEKEWRWSSLQLWYRQDWSKKGYPYIEQNSPPKSRKTPPETKPISTVKLKVEERLLLEWQWCISTAGRNMMGQTLTWTHNPQTANPAIVESDWTVGFLGGELPCGNTRCQKRYMRAMETPSQLPLRVRQMKRGLQPYILQISSDLNKAHKARIASASQNTKMSFPMGSQRVQLSFIMQEMRGEQRQVWRSQGEGYSVASEYTLQSMSVTDSC